MSPALYGMWLTRNVIEVVASLLAKSEEEVIKTSFQNACSLFKIKILRLL